MRSSTNLYVVSSKQKEAFRNIRLLFVVLMTAINPTIYL